eukprot:GHVT01033032.1.p1 GENE.GHVT01033032.1~~GHVT01033032.1.p1  ORF type:complete len:160 (-),score=1.65 GHVT01033032.1:715-1194(-)
MPSVFRGAQGQLSAQEQKDLVQAANFSERDIKRLYKRFQELDSNSNGELDPHELFDLPEVAEVTDSTFAMTTQRDNNLLALGSRVITTLLLPANTVVPINVYNSHTLSPKFTKVLIYGVVHLLYHCSVVPESSCKESNIHIRHQLGWKSFLRRVSGRSR